MQDEDIQFLSERAYRGKPDDPPFARRVRDVAGALAARLGPQDRLVVYTTGHGDSIQKEIEQAGIGKIVLRMGALLALSPDPKDPFTSTEVSAAGALPRSFCCRLSALVPARAGMDA